MQTQVLSSSSSPVSFIIRLIPISLFFFFFFLFRRAVDLCSHSSSMVNYDIAPETLIAPPFSLTCFIRLFLSSSHRFPAPRFHSLSTLCTWCLHDPRLNSHFPAFYKLLSNGIFTMIKILLSLSLSLTRNFHLFYSFYASFLYLFFTLHSSTRWNEFNFPSSFSIDTTCSPGERLRNFFVYLSSMDIRKEKEKLTFVSQLFRDRQEFNNLNE